MRTASGQPVRAVLIAPLLAMIGAGWAAGAPPAKQNAKPPGNVVIATPSIPKLTTPAAPACSADPACEGLAVLKLVNADRLDPANQAETRGLARPLKWNAQLAQIAFAHSKAMAMHHYFSHIDPNGDSPVERFYKEGIQWRAMGENIGKNLSGARAEAAFMSEPRFQPNHRGNILNPDFNCAGIGVFHGPDGMVYVTEDFARVQ